MLFNSIEFLIFFPIVILIYFVIPRKARMYWLLVVSYYFYMSWNAKYAVLIAGSTVVTFFSGILIQKLNDNESLSDHDRTVRKKWVVAGSLIINLGILAVFKYANFALESVDAIVSFFGHNAPGKRLDILLPVGISFYTFQALSYSIDVYRGTVPAEKNLLRYALFVSFFPQLVAGPIERTGNLLPQINNVENLNLWNYERVRDGLLLMLWGFFQKLVIADRISLMVEQVYNNYELYGFLEIFVASMLFCFESYCDFGGYSNIARGAAKVMGFDLMINFRQPYFARSIQEFWRRWHISMTTWFTDYLYIPLGGSRKGLLRKYINIMILFTTSGLWHGASWHYVVWGMLFGIFQIIGDLRHKLMKKIRKGAKPVDNFSCKIRDIIVTFLAQGFVTMFFITGSLTQLWHMFKQMATSFTTVGLLNVGLTENNWFALGFALLVLLIVDLMHENNISIFAWVKKQNIWFRWALYIGLLWATILLGIFGAGYDTSSFLYFQF